MSNIKDKQYGKGFNDIEPLPDIATFHAQQAQLVQALREADVTMRRMGADMNRAMYPDERRIIGDIQKLLSAAVEKGE